MSLDSQLPCSTSSKGTLVLVGGSVRAAAQDAARAGWQIVAVDHYGDADLTRHCSHWFHCNDSRWPDQLTGINARFLVGVGGFERTPQIDAICRRKNLPIVFASNKQAMLVTEPANLASLAADAKIDFPETWKLADNGSGLERIAAPNQPSWDSASRYLSKPIKHAGGIGIRWATSCTSLGPQHWLQRFYDGTPIGVSYLACPKEASGDEPSVVQVHTLGACQSLVDSQHPTEPFIYLGSVGGVELPASVGWQLAHVGQLAATRFELVGLFNIDFILAGSRLTLLEINPRYSASMELLGNPQGVEGEAWSLVDWHLRAFQQDASLNDEVTERLGHNHRKSVSQSRSGINCKRIVYASQEVRFSEQAAQDAIRRIEQQHATADPQLVCCLADIPDGRVASSLVIRTGYPICTLLIQDAADAHSAIQFAERAATELQASLKTH